MEFPSRQQSNPLSKAMSHCAVPRRISVARKSETRLVARLLSSGLLACCVAATGYGAQPAGNAAAKPAKPEVRRSTSMETNGEVKFQQNCSRCHNAPQELSPRISGTVVQHMRVRASLSEADARAILQYLAP